MIFLKEHITMVELKNYRSKNFSVTVNSKMRGIEIRFASKIGNNEIAEMKNAGFRWSRRQQMYAYQNENTIAFADSLIQDFDMRYKQTEKNSERTQGIKDLFASGRHTQGQVRRIREEAKKILAENTDEQIAGNSEMLLLLAQYEGGGGISGEDNRTPAEVLNAFYTPREVVNAVWRLADHYAPNAKTVLEPSCGIGRFAENRDGDKEFTLHELDETSARIAKILHPKANVIQGAFQKQFFDEDGRVVNKDYEPPKYDIVIGNPPYGENKSIWAGRGEGKQFARLEEYFLSRGLDSLKDENSALLFVMPSTFLKSFPDSAKRLVAEKCVLVDAYRLPNGTFDTTDVGTDIIVLKKGSCRAEEISGDNFFKNHPEKILGEEYLGTDRFGKEVTKIRPRGANSLQDELNKIAPQLEKKEERKTEFAVKIAGRYISIQENDGGYDYSIISEDYKTIDGGVIEDSGGDIVNVLEGIIEDLRNGSRSNNMMEGIRDGDKWTAVDYDELAKAVERADTRFSFNEETSARMKDNLEWLVNVRGCDKEKTQVVLEKLYAAELKFMTHREAFERSKAIPLAFGDVHKDAEWVDGKELEETIGIFDETLDYHTVWDRSWAARQGMKKDDVARLLEWDYSARNRFIEKEADSLFPEMQKKSPNHIFVDDFEKQEAKENSTYSEEKRDTERKSTEADFETNEPQKNAVERVREGRYTVQKQKGETLTAQEFARLYGKEFSESEFKIWRATDWEGRIDLSKLDEAEKSELQRNPNYTEIEPDIWTHREFFVSGDIGKKIHEYEKKSGELEAYDSRKLKLYKKNIEILKGILPKAISLESLHFGVNTTLAEEFKVKHQTDTGEPVELNLQESFILWAQGETYQSMLANETYYRSRIDFTTANISLEEFPENVSWYDIVEYIDKKPVKAVPTRKGYRMTDEEVSAEKAQRKREAEERRMARSETADKLFDKYLHEGLSEELGRQVEAEYNRRFNSYVIPDYSKLPLFVDGMSAFNGDDKFRLYDQQIKGISFLSNKGNGLLAYDVGVGKTAAGIVANVNQIQLGRSRRPLIVVPNSVYTKWYNDIKELFPNVQVNDLYNFNKDSLEKFRDAKNLHKLNIPENSISLCTYEALTQHITFTDESCENALYEDFSKLLSEDLNGNAAAYARDTEKIKNAIGSASQVKNSNFVFFEECGFDNITVDEAHNFKNLWTVPRPKKKGQSNEFSGIPSGKPSQRALKLYAMTQLVQRDNDSRNVFLLTATPFTNSPLEVYSMLCYVGRQRLIDSGIQSLRDFLNQFAHTKLEIAVNAQGTIDYKQVMKDWKELPALQKILTEYIDKVDGEEAKIIRPRKFSHVKDLDLTPTQKKMIEADTEHMLEVKEGNSAAVIVSMNAMRLALVAPALADKSRYIDVKIPPMEKLVETSPKLKFVCDSIIDLYRTNPEKGQFMYMPLGQQAHGIIKDYLVAQGIPKETVEIINGSTNNSVEKKERITGRFNDKNDKLKIIIGGKNTSEGIDLNGNSFVMYNCSLGWNPSEITQAEGRVWRQGNLQGHVHCVYPVMNDSIDSVLYQKHDEKLSRIDDIWSYKGENLNVEDIRPEELKFDLIKNPVKRAKLMLDEATKELKAELSKTELRIKSYDEVIKKRIDLKKRLEEADETLEYRENLKRQYVENGNLEIPAWLKSEIADAKKEKKTVSLKMYAINEKLEKLGIYSEESSANYVRKLNVMKHEIEKQIEMKKSELPKIAEKLRLEFNEKKMMLPPLEEQRKELCDEILSNLRPMKEVAFEIKTERFEKMLERKFQSGEITEEQHALYKRAGHDDYEKWICGEIENLEKFLNEKRGKENSSSEVFNTTESKIYDARKEILTNSSEKEIQDLKATHRDVVTKRKAVSDRSSQMSLFSEEELDALSQKKESEANIKNFVDSMKETAKERVGASDECPKVPLIVGGIPKSKKHASVER